MFKRSLLVVLLIAASLPAIADPAPRFSLPTSHGSVSLDSLRGYVVYVDFWASWCDPCRKSFPWMNELQHKFADQGLKIVAVNLDTKQESLDKFLAKYPVNFTIAFDPGGDVAKLYQVKGMPSSYLIDRQGNLVSSHIGFLEKDTKLLEEHVAEVLKQ
jgi:thiol-disulfide isomerase/thioredoxin